MKNILCSLTLLLAFQASYAQLSFNGSNHIDVPNGLNSEVTEIYAEVNLTSAGQQIIAQKWGDREPLNRQFSLEVNNGLPTIIVQVAKPKMHVLRGKQAFPTN